MKKCGIWFILFMLMLTSCVAGGKGSSSKTLDFTPPLGESFKIKLNVENCTPNGNGGTFKTEKSLQVIQKEILEKNDCKVSIFEENLVIEKPINGILQIVTISKYKDFYIFEQPNIDVNELVEEHMNHKASFFAPSFYITIERKNTWYDLFENQWYKIKCSEEEYMNIYKEMNMFEILESDFYTLNVKSSVKNRLSSSIRIEFKCENDDTYIKYYL